MQTRDLQSAHRSHRRRGHPDLPVRSDAVHLPVRPDRPSPTFRDDVGHPLCDEGEAVVGLGSQHSAARVRNDLTPRHPHLLFGVFPDVRLLEEELFVPGTRAAHDEGGRINGFGRPEEPSQIRVQRRVAHGMLEGGMAVHDHAHVETVVRALGRDHETALSRCVGHPLSLVAPGLQVLLDGDCAPVVEAGDVLVCDLVARDLVPPRAVPRVDRIAAAEGARTHQLSCPDELARGEDVL